MAKKTNNAGHKQLLSDLDELGKKIKDMYGETSDAYAKYSDFLYNATVTPTADILDTSSFMKYQLLDAANKLVDELGRNVLTAVQNGITGMWSKSAVKNDEYVEQYMTKINGLSKSEYKKYFNTNDDALQAFLQRKVNGLSLSERVWRYVEPYKNELEIGLEVGLSEGRSATQISRDLRSYLQYPDKLFRRVRNSDGKLKLSKSAAAYHPGRGVYRSSYMNALRLAATEVNMAYRTADYLRWQQLDFVVGQRIVLSNNHNCKGVPKGTYWDICDELSAPLGSKETHGQGCYPKDFKFVGWHPFCRCHVEPILKTVEEMRKDNDAIAHGLEAEAESVNKVTTLPPEFKKWITDNEERIRRAQTANKLPYFIRDNLSAINPILNYSKLSMLEKAELRHQSRTKSQIDDILQRAKKRQERHAAMRKEANDALAQAMDYGEVDYTVLKQYIDSGNLDKMFAEAANVRKLTADMKAKEQILETLIPNAHEWHQKFSLHELQSVYDTVESKMAKWSTLSLFEQANKLDFEIQSIATGQKYGRVREVAVRAYDAQRVLVKYKIDVAYFEGELAPIKAYAASTPDKTLLSILNKFDAAVAQQKPILTLNKYVIRARQEYERLLLTLGAPSSYPQSRLNAAMWDLTGGGLVYDDLTNVVGKAWKKASQDERTEVFMYTCSYCSTNEPLQLRKYYKRQNRTDFEHTVNAITSFVDKTECPYDMWVQRGDNNLGAMLGRVKFNGGQWSGSATDLQSLVGKEIQEGGFMSVGCAKGKGFLANVILNIFVPKGTKMAFLEPFSLYGEGVRSSKWDGVTKTAGRSQEFEAILQRGTKLRVTKATSQNGKIFIDCEVVGQEVKPLSYVPDDLIGF